MWARFIRYMNCPDIAYKQIPVAEESAGSKPRREVYCGDCDCLRSATSGYSCTHESNKLWHDPVNKWYSPNKDFSLREHPKQKNRRNDCLHYSQKIG
jgi:hypothetical protein